MPRSAVFAEPSDRRLTCSFFFPSGCALSLHQVLLFHSCYSGICWLICYPWMMGNSFLVFYPDLLMFRSFHLILEEGFFWHFYHSPISIQHSLESWFARWCCFSKNGWFTFDQAKLILEQPNINERSPELHLARSVIFPAQTVSIDKFGISPYEDFELWPEWSGCCSHKDNLTEGSFCIIPDISLRLGLETWAWKKELHNNWNQAFLYSSLIHTV